MHLAIGGGGWLDKEGVSSVGGIWESFRTRMNAA